ncbi:MAG: ABC transporter permease [Kiritimatiellaeota bacterium]|nr:ABC transporter permease [Kiritimatiellota bacterium]
MTAMWVTWRREVRAYGGSFACYLPVTAFLGVCGWTFVFLLGRYEGTVLQVQSIWGLSVAPWLPVLCAMLTMRLLAEERASGMVELLLSAPVREREFVIGKFLAALTVVTFAVSAAMLVPVVVLPVLSAMMAETVHAAAFAMTWLVLTLQAAVWCAAGLMVSVCFRNQTLAAVGTLVLCGGIPVAVYAAVLAWVPSVRATMAWLPLLVHVYDFSTGLVSTSVVLLYVTLTVLFLFVCSKVLAGLRL